MGKGHPRGDGTFHFKLCYPGQSTTYYADSFSTIESSYIAELDPDVCYEFLQTNNPVTSGVRSGFVFLGGPGPQGLLTGLAKDGCAITDGNTGGSWWFAVGQQCNYSGKIVADSGQLYNEMFLYAVLA